MCGGFFWKESMKWALVGLLSVCPVDGGRTRGPGICSSCKGLNSARVL